MLLTTSLQMVSGELDELLSSACSDVTRNGRWSIFSDTTQPDPASDGPNPTHASGPQQQPNPTQPTHWKVNRQSYRWQILAQTERCLCIVSFMNNLLLVHFAFIFQSQTLIRLTRSSNHTCSILSTVCAESLVQSLKDRVHHDVTNTYGGTEIEFLPDTGYGYPS